MLRDKYGKGMVASDKADLDNALADAIAEVGTNYGDVVEVVCDKIMSGNYSPALKYNARQKTSWLRSYIQSYIELR